MVYIENNTLHTKLYTKPTNRKQYLHFDRCHPIHVKKSLPYYQALRLRHIIDDDHILNIELNTLASNFKSRGYPIKLLNKELDKVKNVKRDSSLIYKSESQKKASFKKFNKGSIFLPLIITYDDRFNIKPSIKDILQKWWHNSVLSVESLQIFQHSSPQIVFKRGKTLNNSLIKAKFSNLTAEHIDLTLHEDIDISNLRILSELVSESCYKVSPCKTTRCKCCNYITSNTTFSNQTNQINYLFNSDMNCSSFNLIYLISCKKCKLQYIGETGMTLRNRLNNHLSCIRTQKNTSVAIHFNDISHSISDLSITPTEAMLNPSDNRHSRENFWIKVLKTFYPFGLNNYPLIK
jgi:hypothetical protein